MKGINYIYATNEDIQIKDNFEKFLYYMGRRVSNSQDYKWAIISLFMFIQGVMISSIKSSNPFTVIKGKAIIENSKKKIVVKNDYTICEKYRIILPDTILLSESIDKSSFLNLVTEAKKHFSISEKQLLSAYTEIYRLISFLDMYKRLGRKEYCCFINDIIIVPTKEIRESIYRINRIRNMFIHYFPMQLAIDTETADHMIKNCLEYSLIVLEGRKTHFLFELENIISSIKEIIKVI